MIKLTVWDDHPEEPKTPTDYEGTEAKKVSHSNHWKTDQDSVTVEVTTEPGIVPPPPPPTPPPPTLDASIKFKTWTINGTPVCCQVSGNLCSIIDAHFLQYVDGRQGYNVTLNETSWLNITQVAGPSGVQVLVVDNPCAVSKTPEPIEKVSQVPSINNSTAQIGNSFNLTLQVPTVLDVRTVWKLANCLNYTKAINWFGISRSFGSPHQCVLFELRLAVAGQYRFTLEASAEVALADDVDVNLGNNRAVSPPLVLIVNVE
jgi:hypothetical protein